MDTRSNNHNKHLRPAEAAALGVVIGAVGASAVNAVLSNKKTRQKIDQTIRHLKTKAAKTVHKLQNDIYHMQDEQKDLVENGDMTGKK